MKYFLLVIVALFILTSCNQESTSIPLTEYEELIKDYDTVNNIDVEQIIRDTVEKKLQSKNTNKESVSLKKIEQQLPEITETYKPISTKIPQDFIDSLNHIHDVFEPEEFKEIAITYFSGLADKLKTKCFFTAPDENVMEDIMEILTTRLNDGTDIVLLIDKTGSMDDDIEQVKSGLSEIENYLSKFDNVKLAIASYGDLNFHGNLWYNTSDLSYDMTQISNFIDTYSTMSNPDTPESVNDAIVKTVKETSWTPGNERLMLVIGDAPSQEAPYSNYTLDDVVQICDSMEVTFNLYPVIIGSTSKIYEVKERNELEVTTYPIPANNYVNINFGTFDTYYVNFYDMSGKLMLNYNVEGSDVRFDVSRLENGNYIAQIMSKDLNKVGLAKISIRK